MKSGMKEKFSFFLNYKLSLIDLITGQISLISNLLLNKIYL